MTTSRLRIALRKLLRAWRRRIFSGYQQLCKTLKQVIRVAILCLELGYNWLAAFVCLVYWDQFYYLFIYFYTMNPIDEMMKMKVLFKLWNWNLEAIQCVTCLKFSYIHLTMYIVFCMNDQIEIYRMKKRCRLTFFFSPNKIVWMMKSWKKKK